MKWLYCLEECEYLAIWPGPHRHSVRDDGTLGIILQKLKRLLKEQALRYINEEQYALLEKHGYDPNALACGTVYRPPTRTYPFNLADERYIPGTLLRSRVCELDGILIEGHERSDLDPGEPTCIHCGKQDNL